MAIEFVSPERLQRVRWRWKRLAGEPALQEGWRCDEKSAEMLVSVFDRLHVSPAFRLITYARSDDIGGRGWTFGTSADAAASSLEDLVIADQFAPKPPSRALPHFMDAIVGDGSFRSYVQASILAREIAELGAWWHGLDWSVHGLVGPSAEPRRPIVYGGTLNGAKSTTGVIEAAEWRWSNQPPKDWRPRVECGDDRAPTVTFWSYSEFMSYAVYEHRDVYTKDGSLTPVSVAQRKLAEGPGGYVF